MALKLAVTDNRGVTANYHRIISVTQVYENGMEGIHIDLAGYVSKEYRDKESLPADDPNYVKQTAIMNTPVFLPFSKSDPNLDRAGLYSRMKAEIVELARAKDE